jgi:transcriptional regulator with XRE-family HTH domain
MKTKPVKELLDEIYLESDNKQGIDYYAAISGLVMESIEARSKKGMAQKDLAKAMGTMQSAISRFENMGREPGYKFIARMAQALGHAPGVTLYGDFMAIVKPELQEKLRDLAESEGKTTQTYLHEILNNTVKDKIEEAGAMNYSLVGNSLEVVFHRTNAVWQREGQENIIPFTILTCADAKAEYQISQ